ncbi:MAG: RNA-binding domain-containing protein [Haloferacaceae archaeon]
MIYRVDVRVVAPVEPTEASERVADAVRAIFPSATIQEEPGRIVAEGHDLERLSELLSEQSILDTARREFFRRADEDGFSFALKKQAAYEGVVNFAVGNPDELGDVEVHVTVHEPSVEAYVDHVAPETVDGEPVE